MTNGERFQRAEQFILHSIVHIQGSQKQSGQVQGGCYPPFLSLSSHFPTRVHAGDDIPLGALKDGYLRDRGAGRAQVQKQRWAHTEKREEVSLLYQRQVYFC